MSDCALKTFETKCLALIQPKCTCVTLYFEPPCTCMIAEATSWNFDSTSNQTMATYLVITPLCGGWSPFTVIKLMIQVISFDLKVGFEILTETC